MDFTGYSLTESIRSFMYKVYGWMAVGLTLTAGSAYYVASNKAVFHAIFSNPLLVIALFIGLIVLAVSLGARVMYMQLSTAIGIFLAYSLLTGVSLSTLFYVYQLGSIYQAFLISAGMFGVFALYGYLTNDDLTGIGAFARMGLIGLIIALFVNMFMRSAQAEYIISLLGVGIFTLLTAYDSQKIKQLGQMVLEQKDARNKVALLGALTLYLDFLNLFLFLLRLFGKRNED